MLTAVGSFNVFCSAMSVQIQGVRSDGLPDGTTVATGTFASNLTAIGGIALTPAIPMTIGSRFAIVFSSTTLCDVTNAPATFDGYFAGDGYSDNGSGWTLLASTDGKVDLPFRSLIQPAADVAFFRVPHSNSAATLLNDGRVLLTGGSSPEVLDPATNSTAFTGNMAAIRNGSTATRLANGTVLVLGGSVFTNTTTYSTAAEIFNPATNTFSTAPSPMNFGRVSHTATLLSDGTVLITGGFGPSSILQGESTTRLPRRSPSSAIW